MNGNTNMSCTFIFLQMIITLIIMTSNGIYLFIVKNIFVFKSIIYDHLLKNKKPNVFLLYCMKSKYPLEDNISLNIIFLDTDNCLSTKKEISFEKT